VRAFQAGALGHFRHAAVLTREQVLEIQALEGLARLAVGAIERDFGRRRGARGS